MIVKEFHSCDFFPTIHMIQHLILPWSRKKYGFKNPFIFFIIANGLKPTSKKLDGCKYKLNNTFLLRIRVLGWAKFRARHYLRSNFVRWVTYGAIWGAVLPIEGEIHEIILSNWNDRSPWTIAACIAWWTLTWTKNIFPHVLLNACI